MIPWETLDEAPVPGNRGKMHLVRRGEEYVIRIDGQDLMGSRMYGSERELATLALDGLATENPHVLIGGLGLGFTLAAALEVTGPAARIEIAELVPAVLEWNKTYLGHLAGHPLDDDRSEVRLADVCDLIRTADEKFDAILLDVDNGPDGMTQSANQWLYDADGLRAIYNALAPGGVLGVWAAFEDPPYTRRAQKAGFEVEVVRTRARGKKGPRHTIWLARRR